MATLHSIVFQYRMCLSSLLLFFFSLSRADTQYHLWRHLWLWKIHTSSNSIVRCTILRCNSLHYIFNNRFSCISLCVYAACVIFFLRLIIWLLFFSSFICLALFSSSSIFLCYFAAAATFSQSSTYEGEQKAHTEITDRKRSTNKTADLFGLFLLHTTAYTTYSCSNHNFYYGPETWTNGFHVGMFADFSLGWGYHTHTQKKNERRICAICDLSS